MFIFKTLVFSISALGLIAAAAPAEIVVVTKPLPDLNGDIWSREYFDVDHAFFDIPEGVTITAGISPSPIRPTITRRVTTKRGRPVVLDAWVNVIDIEKQSYYAGDLEKWFPLDSAKLIQINDGFDTCSVYLRTCYRSGAPLDSCRTVRTKLYEKLSISDIAYIVFTSFDFANDVDFKISSKSKYSYRSLLGYLVREVPLEKVIDYTTTDAVAWPIRCDCLHDVKAESIRRVEYMSDISDD